MLLQFNVLLKLLHHKLTHNIIHQKILLQCVRYKNVSYTIHCWALFWTILFQWLNFLIVLSPLNTSTTSLPPPSLFWPPISQGLISWRLCMGSCPNIPWNGGSKSLLWNDWHDWLLHPMYASSLEVEDPPALKVKAIPIQVLQHIVFVTANLPPNLVEKVWSPDFS